MQTAVPEERVVWQGSPSQWLNFTTYLVGGLAATVIVFAFALVWLAPPEAVVPVRGVVLVALAALLAIPAFFSVRNYLLVKTLIYTVTSERIRVTRGIFSKQTDDLELYRVDDMRIVQPFLLRLVSRGNVVAVSSDRTTPELVLEAIPRPMELRDEMRRHVEACRDRKRTRVMDME